jgi:hypothetical protein
MHEQVLGCKSNMRTALIPPPYFLLPSQSPHSSCRVVRYTNNFDFASDLWATMMFHCSGGSGHKRPASFFSPEKPPVYPNKHTPAPPPSSAAAAAATPSAQRLPPNSSFSPASGNDSPRTRARAGSSGASTTIRLPSSCPVASAPSHHPSAFSAVASAAEQSTSPHVVYCPSSYPTAVAGSSYGSAAAAAAAAASLRRSPRLTNPPTTNTHTLAAAAPAKCDNAPAKTLGRADDARQSRIVNLTVRQRTRERA